jgi:hypothetical protein
MFLWVNMGRLLPLLPRATLWDSEAALYDELVASVKVVLTPGASQHHPEPGWFRICYAFVSPTALSVALDRVEFFIGQLFGKSLENEAERLHKLAADLNQAGHFQESKLAYGDFQVAVPTTLILSLKSFRSMFVIFTRASQRPVVMKYSIRFKVRT